MSVQKDRESFLDRLTDIIYSNISNEQFGVNELAREMGMSRSNLHRKIKAEAETSVSKYITLIRLERAIGLLKESSSTISEIAFECGFHSATYFSKCFRDHYGYPPGKVGQIETKGDSSDHSQLHHSRRGIGKRRISLTWLISVTFILIAVIVLLIIFKPSAAQDQSLEKSIAVLPFINDSPDESEMYFINGTMEAILNNLGTIKDLRVVSRTSVEQYRDNPTPTKQIAEEMDVSYILEGSGMKHSGRIWLRVQLIDAKNDKHLWSESYQRKSDKVIELYSEVAQSIAKEIGITITSEETGLIEKIPTSNIVAYEFYQKAQEGYWEYYFNRSNETLQKAEDLYRYALEYDSTFARAHVGVAWIYWYKYERDISHAGKYLDSVKMTLETALSYDDQLAGAYNLRGHYYRLTGEEDKAVDDYNRSLKLNPNSRGSLSGMAWIHWQENDYLGAIEYFHRAVSIGRGRGFADLLRYLADGYFMTGFEEQFNHYSRLAFEVDGDSATYFNALARNESTFNSNNPRNIELLLRGYKTDSTNVDILQSLGWTYLYQGQYAESVRYWEEYLDRLNALGQKTLYGSLGIGLSYWMNGDREKADYFFDQHIIFCLELIESDKSLHSSLSQIYAIRGEREKAYEHLRKFNELVGMPIYVTGMKDDLFYKNIRNEPEFLQIASEIEAKYQAEHERVRQWLEEKDML